MQDLLLICASYKCMQTKPLNIQVHITLHTTLWAKENAHIHIRTSCQSHALGPIPPTPGPNESHIPEASGNTLLWGSLLSWWVSFCLPRSFLFLKSSIVNHIFLYCNEKPLLSPFLLLCANNSWTGFPLPMESWAPSGWEIAASVFYTQYPQDAARHLPLRVTMAPRLWERCASAFSSETADCRFFPSYYPQPWLDTIYSGPAPFLGGLQHPSSCILFSQPPLSYAQEQAPMHSRDISLFINDTID